jgi:hypothetical protein
MEHAMKRKNTTPSEGGSSKREPEQCQVDDESRYQQRHRITSIRVRCVRQFKNLMTYAESQPEWAAMLVEAKNKGIAEGKYDPWHGEDWDFWSSFFEKLLRENVPFRRTNLGRRVSRWLKLDAIIYAPLFPKKPKAKKSDTRKN